MKTTPKTDTPELDLIAIAERFSAEEAARDLLESIRWPSGTVCPHCGVVGTGIKIPANPEAKVRPGLYRCPDCSKQFTVTVGTIFEDSHIPLNKWLMAFYVMCASKTLVSALQLQRMLKLGSYRTAWFMCHRIRFAMTPSGPQGKLGGTVEADETWVGGKQRGHKNYRKNKTEVIALVERNGRVRSHVVERISGDSIVAVLRENVHPSAALNTDESKLYRKVGQEFASHDTVNHQEEEYSRKDPSGRVATTNTIEGFFGNSKRSIDGTHHHISKKHAPLYFAELDYKYNTRKMSDGARTMGGLATVDGKRLTLRPMKGTPRNGVAD